jgi:hypothetical protein
MKFNIIYTSIFEKEFKWLSAKHLSLKKDFKLLLTKLELDPLQGEPLGNNCFKIRLAISSKGKGKSGGARVITCVKVVANTVYLVAIYDKSDRESISNKEIQARIKPFSS